jgi:hypothetical protein
MTYGAQSANISQGRYPDGSSTLVAFQTATPGSRNLYGVGANLPPIIGSIGTKYVTLGRTLAFDVQASDPDGSASSLVFGLVPDGSAGATMDPSTGTFTWTPTAAPATNRFTVSVTDAGAPPLASTMAFDVYVFRAPQLSNVSFSAEGLAFRVRALPGEVYQLEVAQNVALGPWSAVGNPSWVTAQSVRLSSRSIRFRFRWFLSGQGFALSTPALNRAEAQTEMCFSENRYEH